MSTSSTVHRMLLAVLAISALVAVGTASAQVPLTQISTDTFTNSDSQHATEVGADTHAVGSTIVSVFQVGRFIDGGASDIGFSTSIDGGTTWTHGNLPGITKIEGSGGWDRANYPTIAYDAKHKVWLAGELGLSGTRGAAVLVSRSTDGITWKNPSTVSNGTAFAFYDKPRIGCDSTRTSPFFGNCYVTWDDQSQFDLLLMSTSIDGGKTWGAKKLVAGGIVARSGIPLVQPNGRVIVPVETPGEVSWGAFQSNNGGKTWGKAFLAFNINEHGVGGGMRAFPYIAAQMDSAGRVYVAWQDCSFRAGCSSNDIIFSTSDDGLHWTAPSRVPIDRVSSTVDHFTPGWAIDPATSGSTAHISLIYNFFPNASCTTTCNLSVGYIASTNGGSTWTKTILSKGVNPDWLALTDSGLMVGDYTSGVFVNGKVYGVFAVATRRTGGGGTRNEEMFTNAVGLADAAEEPQYSSKNDKPVPNAHSDHPRRTTPYREDGR